MSERVTVINRVNNWVYWHLPRFKRLYHICQRYVNFYDGHTSINLLDVNGERRFLERVLARRIEAVVFDVGANVGEWARIALAISPTARLHCFEPVSTTFEQLAAQRFPPNVTLNRLALGRSTGTATMYVYKNSLLSSLQPVDSLFGTPKKPLRLEEVPIDTVANYCLERHIKRVHFLKIDAEGHDFPVLEGARPLLENGQIDVVQFEYGPGYIDARIFLKDIFDFLEPLRYSVFKILPRYLVRVSGYSWHLENFRLVNYALVRDELLPELRSYIHE